jgi:16S rRNA (cytidine1402-2'-O)-methyltransferase
MATLYLVATPVGNLEDLTFRAARLLGEVDALACEDTRHTRLLFARHGIRRPPLVFSCHEHNEAAAAARIVELLDAGRSVALCSNAGTPALSDPGFHAVRRALAAGHRVEALPGACAAALALVSSGLPSSSFTFKGFPPRRPGRRRRFLQLDCLSPHTLIFYESPRRLANFLSEARDVYGDRQGAVCLELTKKFERIERGPLAELAARFRDAPPLGEATVVIAGCASVTEELETEAGASESAGREQEDE